MQRGKGACKPEGSLVHGHLNHDPLSEPRMIPVLTAHQGSGARGHSSRQMPLGLAVMPSLNACRPDGATGNAEDGEAQAACLSRDKKGGLD